MTNDMNNMMQIIMKTAKSLYDNEKFLVSYLAARAEMAAQEYPHDSTLVGISNFLNRKASARGSMFITRAELKDIYNKLYTNKTKTALYFAEELGLAKESSERTMHRNPKEGESLQGTVGDSFLKEQLSSALNKETPQQYTGTAAKEAMEVCGRELARHGLESKKIEVMAGNTQMLICSAQCETPKGHSHVLVPVEIRNNRALLPSVFYSTEGFVSLNKEFLIEHLHKTAGKSYKVDAYKLLNSLSDKKEIRTLSDVERVVFKTASEKGKLSPGTPNNILYQEIDPEKQNLETQADPKDVASFAKKLNSDAGAAEFTFGRNVVDKGRQLVLAELAHAGHRQSQISVAGVNQDSIKYAVSVGNVGFHVPVKVTADRLMAPSVVVAAGKPYSFNAQGINKLISESSSDFSAMIRNSSCYGQKPGELVDNVRSALLGGDFKKAEDALHVLQASEDKSAFRTAFEIYSQALSGKTLKEESQCSAPRKVSNSQHLICSHTNLPIHKVYQDKYGNCQPLYRKHMDQTSEGGISLNSKIFRN